MDREIEGTSKASKFFLVFFHPTQSGIKDPVVQQQTKRILIDTGKFFQVQDDYLDCCGDPEVTGKIGTDIEDGKCSWMVVMAMQRANSKQKEILKVRNWKNLLCMPIV